MVIVFMKLSDSRLPLIADSRPDLPSVLHPFICHPSNLLNIYNVLPHIWMHLSD